MQTQTQFQSPHSRWLALTHRTRSSHSSFLYGVKSTKIYCRPTCSARLARRANIVFYDSADQARRDGFRPCKRCKPDNPAFVGESEEVVSRVLALLRGNSKGSNYNNGQVTMKRSLKQLAEEVGVTPSYLCRVFKKTMGVTIGVYITEFEKESTVQFPTNNIDAANIPTIEIEEDAGNMDCGFNLDEWFFTDEFLHDSIYNNIEQLV
jgi:methylphosphotriester-DNA--protein-cysteine methyltransferase